MGTVVALPQNPNRSIEQRMQARQMVAYTLRANALGEAYLHVLEFHPEKQTIQDRLALSVEIAKVSLFAAAKGLMENTPFILSDVRTPPS